MKISQLLSYCEETLAKFGDVNVNLVGEDNIRRRLYAMTLDTQHNLELCTDRTVLVNPRRCGACINDYSSGCYGCEHYREEEK